MANFCTEAGSGDGVQTPHPANELTQDVRALEARIASRKAVVGVVGQDGIGFPLAQRIARRGYRTLGFDLNGDTVVRCGEESRVRKYRGAMTILELRQCDVIIVGVPTPTRRNGGAYEPDLTNVLAAVGSLAEHVIDDSRARLLVLESMYAPGTTRRMVLPIIAEKHAVGTSVLLGYSPERIDPGNGKHHLGNTPKITSGCDPLSARLTQLFYSQFIDTVVPASSVEAAEATKVLENTFRFINIAFAQEFDAYCERAGVDALEVTGLAATKPFGFMPFYAGPGIGGHSIAEAPYFLHRSMVEAGMEPRFMEAAIGTHEARQSVIVERIVRQLGGRPIHGARILLLGVSYKPNVAETRQSPAMSILKLLEAEGASVDYHDSHVPRFAGRTSTDLAKAAPESYDLAVLLTEHVDINGAALQSAGWKLFRITGAARAGRESPRRPLGARLLGRTRQLVGGGPMAEVRS